MAPHDLLFLRAGAAFVPGGDQPDWLDAAWTARAPLVVRRSVAGAGLVPVGARGPQRNQRCAGVVAAADVVRRVTPDMLAGALPPASGDDFPCIAALRALAPQLSALGLAWGPAGGAGFWLASGLPVLRASSDLDLLVRAPLPLDARVVAALCALQADSACRIDIQVDTGHGGFALSEYARGGRVLLKTARGPVLVADPWREPVAA
jgi:phosphoribosyl-dephospho-CoA transferase